MDEETVSVTPNQETFRTVGTHDDEQQGGEIRKSDLAENQNSAQEIGDGLRQSPDQQPSREKALVVYAYKAEHEDELDLVEGEEVVVLEREIEDPGWYRGEAHGKVGVFPDNFVRLIPQRPKKPPPPSREALARSTHMSGQSPPPADNHTQTIETSKEPIAEQPIRPPPLPPKEANLTGPKPGKIGMGAIPNIGQLRNMLRPSSGSPTDNAASSGPAPPRSLFYISAPSADNTDPSLLIVPEPGSSVTTVLFHPTKHRAKPPNRKHDRRQVVKFDESTLFNDDNDSSPSASSSQKENVQDEIIESPHPVISKTANSSTTNNTNPPPPLSKPSYFKPPVDVPASVSEDLSSPVWEKRVSPEPVTESNVLASLPSSLPPKKQPPVAPPKKVPPAVPKKTVNRHSTVIPSDTTPSSTPEPRASSASPSPVPSGFENISTRAREHTNGGLKKGLPLTSSVPISNSSNSNSSVNKQAEQTQQQNAMTAINARCDRLDKLVQDLRRDVASAQSDIRRLTQELDEEKKLRLAAQVDLDRLRKTINSNANSSPPARPPPPPLDVGMPTTAL